MFHSDIPLGDRHPVFNWTYADATARTGASGFVASDIGKLAKQLDDNTYWELTAITPTWAQITGGGAVAFGDLSDVTLAGEAQGDLVVYDGAGWVNQTDITKEDAVTSAVTEIVALGHNSTGTPASGFGTGLSFEAETSTTPNTLMGTLEWEWFTATHASRWSRFRMFAYYIGNKVEIAHIVPPAAASYAANARGGGSVDFQSMRSAADQVASGYYAAILSGRYNKVTQNYSVVAGGSGNQITTPADYGFIGAGKGNIITNASAVIGGGYNNHAYAGYNFIGGGKANTLASGATLAAISGGYTNYVSGTGDYGFIGGGRNNKVGGLHGVVGGGSHNYAYGNNQFIGGGDYNSINAAAVRAAIAGGQQNAIAAGGLHGFIGGGYKNKVEGYRSVVTGGQKNYSYGPYQTIIGGYNNIIVSGANWGSIIGGGKNYITATGDYSAVVGGTYGKSERFGEVVHASGKFANTGDAQSVLLIVRGVETHSSTTWRELYTNGSTLRITIPVDTVVTYDCLLSGITQGTAKRFAFRLEGAISNDGGTTVQLNNTVTTVYDSDDVSFDARASADDTNDALLIEVSDSDGTGDVVRWVGVVRLCQVNFPA